MKPKKNAKAKFSVTSSDRCIWLNDLRGKSIEIHMVPKQAIATGKALVEIGESAENGKSQNRLIS